MKNPIIAHLDINTTTSAHDRVGLISDVRRTNSQANIRNYPGEGKQLEQACTINDHQKFSA